MLTIQAYDRAEQAARARLSMREAQAFSPATFEDQNYPVRVSDESSLLRYVDTMHETFEGKFFDAELYRYTRAEADLIADVAERVARMTEQRFGRAVRPWMAPFGAIPALRVIGAFAAKLGIDRPRVFEIGPGSGYLGALLVRAGHSYWSMDNTQGFYLWQSRLLETLTADAESGAFRELAAEDDWESRLDAPVGHLAWWQWAAMGASPPIDADVVVCDHALGEMHPLALRYVLRTVRRILAGDGPRMFFFTSPGKEHCSDLNAIGRACLQSGLELLTFGNFLGFTTPESSLSPWSIPAEHAFKTRWKYRLRRLVSPVKSRLAGTPLAEFEARIPLYGQVPGETLLGGAEILPVRAEEQPLDYPFLTAAGFRTPLDVAGEQQKRIA